MKKTAAALTLTILMLSATFSMSPVQGDLWTTPKDIVPATGRVLFRDPILSGDGTRIAFYAHMIASNNYSIAVVDWNGSGLRPLHEDALALFGPSAVGLSYPSISQDGEKVVFSSLRFVFDSLSYSGEDYCDIILATVNGTEDIVASNLDYYYDYRPNISADGDRIAFLVSISLLYVVNSDGTGLLKLSENALFSPGLSGDGGKVAFFSGKGYRNAPESLYPAKADVFIINSDGTELTKIMSGLTLPTDPYYGNVVPDGPSISGDGSKIVFSDSADGDSEIFLINADGSGLRQLTNNSVSDLHPAISADGSRIVFISRRASALPYMFDVFVVNSDGTGLAKITANTSLISWLSGWDYASISGDGRRVIFSVTGERICGSELEASFSVGSPSQGFGILLNAAAASLAGFVIIGMILQAHFKKRQKDRNP